MGEGGTGGADAVGDRGALTGYASAGPPRPAAVSAAVMSGGGEFEVRTVPACGMSPPAGSVAGDVDADFHHRLGSTSVTFSFSRLPNPAENVHPVHGCPLPAGATATRESTASRLRQRGGAAGVP
jgi:hypothetical protein